MKSEVNPMSPERTSRGSEVELQDDGRRPYEAPRLTHLGDVRDLTLGGSPTDIGDSGDFNTRSV